MKLKHLLALALVAMGSSAWAQEVPTDGTSYYLYNTETGKFLARGNEWGTRAIVNNYGQPWKVTIQDGKYQLQMLDILNAGEKSANNLNGDYSDNKTAVAYAPTGEADGYVLGNGDDKWLGVSSSYYVNTAGTDAAKTWQFLTKAQYDAKQVEIQNAQYQALIDASLIDATPETLANVLASATATDVTTPAGLNGVPTKSTWAETQHGNRGGNYNEGSSYGLECYQTGNAHITKTVSGLEEGIYKVKVKAMYRSTTNAACLATGNAGYTNSSAYFAANGYTVQIKDWYSGHTADAVPNNTGEVVTIINNGGYTSEFYTYVGPSGTLNLEAVSEAYWGGCWFIFNGVELTKYSGYPTQKMADNTDLTSWLTNPSFESGNMNGWTNNSADGMWTMMTRANDTDPKVGVYWVEKYGKSGKIDVSQTLTKMPAGHYQISVTALDQASKTKLIAQCGDVTIETPIVGGTKAVYTADIMLEDNSDLKISIYCDNHNANSWVGFDDFHLTYVSAELPELPASATGAMNVDIAAAQTSAVNAYNTNKTAANYNTALAAIDAAKNSVELYTANKAALDAQKALMDATNVYDADGFAAYNTAYETALAAYNDGTANEVVVNPNSATGWHATTAYNFLLTPWKLGESACNEFANALYINTWSNEGSIDGSNFTVPFFEYWVGDAEMLGNNTLTGTVTGLDNGLYSATALVRVRATNGVDATDATGIYLSVNGGTAVDATEGTQVGETQFTLAEVTAEGLVKDGTLNISFDVKDTNISWLSFKNVKYAKVRDLNPEEQMVHATDEEIAAFKAAVEAAEAKTVGFKAGNYSPYANAEVIKALADAKTIDTDNPVDVEIINAAIAAIADENWTVNAEEVNAINNGDFEGSYAAVSGAGVSADRDIFLPTGWSFRKNGINTNDIVVLNTSDKAGNNVTSISSLENGGNNTIMYRGKWGNTTNLDFYQKITLPAGTYTLECDAWKSGLGGDGKIYVGANNEASLDGNETSWRKLSLIFVLDEEKTVEVGFNIKHNNDGSEKFIGFDNFVLKEIPAITRSTQEGKYGTICAPFAAKAEGAKVYSAAVNGNEVELTEVTEMVAGTPYIYQATENAQTFSYASGSLVEEPVAAAPLVGVFEATPVPVGSYVMQTQNGAQKFYIVAEGKQPTLSANKAYLTVPASEAKTLSIGFAEETAIKAIDALMSGDAKIYDLNGREQKSLQKGVNIVNGVKVLVK